MPPLHEYPDELFQGALPAAGAGPVEDLGFYSRDLVAVLRVVKGTRGTGRGGARIFGSHPDVNMGDRGEQVPPPCVVECVSRNTVGLKRSLETFNAALETSVRPDPAILPSFENMHSFLTSSHYSPSLAPALLTSPHPSANVFDDEALRARSVRTDLPFDPANPDRVHAEHSLARTPRALLGLRAAARYGLDKDEWERRAHGLYE